jgi:hypothetical protein
MPESVTSAFSEPKDFSSAMRGEGYCVLLITGQGNFRAQLTQILPGKMRLSACQEALPRIGFVQIPADAVHVWFPLGNQTAPVCGGIRMRAGELMILCPGGRFHARTDGVSGWGAIRLPAAEFVRYNILVSGAALPIPSTGRRLRPPPEAYRQLRGLHAAAIRMATRSPHRLIDDQAAHGLEQQILHALMECLPEGAADDTNVPEPERPNLVAVFNDLLESGKNSTTAVIEICRRFQICESQLLQLCVDHLGMSPNAYDRLRRTSQA